MDKFVLIDGNNLVFRAFYALPQLSNFQGEISNAVFGFCNMLLKVIDLEKPKYIAVAFDKGKNTFRHRLYKEYKAQRNPTPKELLDQLPIVKNMLDAMKIKHIELDNAEADDIIGTLSRKYNTQNIVVSADHDLYQLINENTSVLSPKKGISETKLYDEATLYEEMEVRPNQIIDLKALMGDASDNIPGVKGIGPKTAVALLKQYDTLDGVYSCLDSISGKLKEKLEMDRENAYLSKTLATIMLDVDLNYELEDFVYHIPFESSVKDLFVRYQFNSLLKRTDLFLENNTTIIEDKIEQADISNLQDLDSLILDAQNNKYLAIYNNEILSFYAGGKEYNLNLQQDLFSTLSINDVLQKLNYLFYDENIIKYVFDFKSLRHKIDELNMDIVFRGKILDIVLMRYLINSTAKVTNNIGDLCMENNISTKYFAYSLYKIAQIYMPQIKKENLEQLYDTIELPLENVLYEMEKNGFSINVQELNLLRDKYEEQLQTLTSDIYLLAGKQFNINSPKQLSKVLFEDLKIRSYNNKKNSTRQDILKDIEFVHPIIGKILKYRELFKLYSTYIVAFYDLIRPDGKIHTMFNQCLTSTGRLSSSEPNLQNIPVRRDEGKNIRKMFVPSFENGYIVSSDYSQIELRLLAHFSEDENLISAYKNNVDIHSLTASKIFNVDIGDVTDIMRRQAKAINFGIIYGISDYGLSQNIGTSTKTAKEFITKYFEEHKRVKEYMDKNIQFAKEHGYVTTLFNRIRRIPEVNSSNYQTRQFGERASMNMPLQGTASDIIKLAMIRVQNEFVKHNLKSKLILQVHDELVVDTAYDELEIVKNILKQEMENVVTLLVPLTVNISYGKTWFDA